MSKIVAMLMLMGAATNAVASEWSVSSKQSKMGDGEVMLFMLTAREPITTKTGRKVVPDLRIRCDVGKSVELIVNTEATLETSGSYARARLRYDTTQPIKVSGITSTDYQAIYIPNAKAHIQRILKAQKLLIEVTPWMSGDVVIEFDISGLEKLGYALKRGCGIASGGAAAKQ